jgi:hypothetical protein
MLKLILVRAHIEQFCTHCAELRAPFNCNVRTAQCSPERELPTALHVATLPTNALGA